MRHGAVGVWVGRGAAAGVSVSRLMPFDNKLVPNQVHESVGIQFTNLGWQAAARRPQAERHQGGCLAPRAARILLSLSGARDTARALWRGIFAGRETVSGNSQRHSRSSR